MATETILLLAIYAFVILGLFMGGEESLLGTFKSASPRLATRIERNVSIGVNNSFTKKNRGGDKTITWEKP